MDHVVGLGPVRDDLVLREELEGRRGAAAAGGRRDGADVGRLDDGDGARRGALHDGLGLRDLPGDADGVGLGRDGEVVDVALAAREGRRGRRGRRDRGRVGLGDGGPAQSP